MFDLPRRAYVTPADSAPFVVADAGDVEDVATLMGRRRVAAVSRPCHNWDELRLPTTAACPSTTTIDNDSTTSLSPRNIRVDYFCCRRRESPPFYQIVYNALNNSMSQ